MSHFKENSEWIIMYMRCEHRETLKVMFGKQG